MRDFKKIKAWQMADDLTVAIYAAAGKCFPSEERYGLTSQIRRAAVSVASNIAEGARRRHKKEFLHFLDTANGSLGEVEYQLHLARRLGYFGEEEYLPLAGQEDELSRTLYSLITSVEKESRSGESLKPAKG